MGLMIEPGKFLQWNADATVDRPKGFHYFEHAEYEQYERCL